MTEITRIGRNRTLVNDIPYEVEGIYLNKKR